MRKNGTTVGIISNEVRNLELPCVHSKRKVVSSMYHFLVLTHRHGKLLHGVVVSHAELPTFVPVEADWYSEKYNLTKCVYHESYATEEEAHRRLDQFSKWSREKKHALVEQSNPGMLDLTVRIMRYERHL